MGLLDIVAGVFNVIQNVNQSTAGMQRDILEKADAYGKQRGQHLKPEYQRQLDRFRENDAQRNPWKRN